ncbi:MAG TPA: FtsX-like permease family protein [Steroidobacteraceae bacterium]|nr:FtsX-like permease family protein [Steroidobacteraceae bacterium]
MSANLRPTLLALTRNRTGPLLAAAQIAIALAVLVNAAYIAHQRIGRLTRPTGIDVEDLFQVYGEGFTSRYNPLAALHEDLAYLRGLPGVVDASPALTVPMGGANQSWPLFRTAEARGGATVATVYGMDDHGLHTLGAHLLAGRNFRPDEVLDPQSPSFSQIIVTESAARSLFPHGDALGRTVYAFPNMPLTIIGIMNDVIATAWASTHYGAYDAMIVPRTDLQYGNGYLVRTAPGQRDRLMRIVEQHLSASNPNRVIDYVQSLAYFAKRLRRDDLNLTIFLTTVTVLVVAVACLGIFSLATFNVTARTKQIGTRRAVGARRADIIQYFLIENGLITTSGVLVGCVLALGLGYWLSLRYQLPRLDLYYLLGGVLALWAIGQIAAWQPARRAAAVPPSVATRTI